jgi:thymidylate kinase
LYFGLPSISGSIAVPFLEAVKRMSTSPTPPDPRSSGALLEDSVATSSSPEIPEAVASPLRDTIDLPSGKELSESSATSLAAARPVRWVVIAGAVGSGKTTLLTSLYEMFQWAPIGEYCFAGSNTLPALEERCHLSRLASERVVPDTQRTLYKDDSTPTYVHVKVRAGNGFGSIVDFLFSDVCGEMFEHARDSTDECKELAFLRRAEHFVVLLDSEKAVRADKRWATIEDAKALLQSCLDSEMLRDECVVYTVWSKFDYFAAAGDTQEHKDFRSEVERGFRATFAHRITNLTFCEIAARPTEAPDLGFGRGVPELLKGWFADWREKEPMNVFPKPLEGTRESELFAIRHPANTTEP